MSLKSNLVVTVKTDELSIAVIPHLALVATWASVQL